MGRKVFFVLCGIITLLLVSCGKNTVTDTSMNSNKTLNVAYQNSIAYAPILVAKEKGLIEKNYTGDVTVNYKLMGNGAEINEAITSGSLDVGCLGASVAITGIGNGAPYRIFTGLSSQPYGIMTNRSSIHSLKDITEDTQVAITNINSHPHILLAMAAKEYLGDAHALDSNLVVLGNADGYTSLISEAVDCHMVISPYNFMEDASEDPDIHEIEISKNVWPNGNTFIVGVASNRLHDEDPELYQALCAAIEEAIAYIKDNPEETAKILSEGYDASVEEILGWMKDERSSYNSELKGVMELSNFMAEENFLDTDKKPNDITDLVFDNVNGE